MAPCFSPDGLIEFFDALAERWDGMQSPERDAHLARLLEPHVGLFEGARQVLDVGSGTGAFLPHLYRLTPGARVLGLDLSAGMLARARRKGHACCWLRGDAHHLPITDGQFDLITCHDSFAHFENYPAVLGEFRRVLVPGGRLLILHDISRERLNMLHGSATHPRIRTHTLPPVEELVPVIQAAGFVVLSAADAPDHYLLSAQRV